MSGIRPEEPPQDGSEFGGRLPLLTFRIAGNGLDGTPYAPETVLAAGRVLGHRVYSRARQGLDWRQLAAAADATGSRLYLTGWHRAVDSQAGAVVWVNDEGECLAALRRRVAAWYLAETSAGRRVALTLRPALLA
ncbi:hypothetical protein ACWDTT_15880 [Streptosporangium sandarakinum]